MDSFGWANAKGRGIFRIDVNFGTPAAAVDAALLPPRPPDAGARGGFVVDLRRRDGKPTEVRMRSIGGTMTSVGYAGTSRTVRLNPGGSVTLKDVAW